jgi:hypothetical protein
MVYLRNIAIISGYVRLPKVNQVNHPEKMSHWGDVQGGGRISWYPLNMENIWNHEPVRQETHRIHKPFKSGGFGECVKKGKVRAMMWYDVIDYSF